MRTLDYIKLDSAAAAKVVESLQQLLADYQVFYANLRGFHWNIKGHGFFVLHSKFEDLSTSTTAAPSVTGRWTASRAAKASATPTS